MNAASWVSTAAPLPKGGSSVSGRVEAVFDRTFNVGLGDELLTVAWSGLGKVPNGIGIRGGAPPFARMGLRVGMRVSVDNRRLHVANTGFHIDLDAATRWSPRPLLGTPHPPAVVSTQLDLAANLAASCGRAGGLVELLPGWRDLLEGQWGPHRPPRSLLGRRCAPAIASVLAALTGTLDEAVFDAAAGLVGLGPGLTPSGDDLLVGLFGALVAVRGDAEPRLARLGERIAAAAAPRTTSVAAAYLRHAGRGELSEHMGSLLRAVLEGDRREVARAVDRCVKVGETSGVDGLLGVVLAVAFLCESEQRLGLSPGGAKEKAPRRSRE